MGYPFQQFQPPTAQSPGIPSGASPVPFANGKFNPRQSISFTGSPFQFPQQGQYPGMQPMNGTDSPSFANINGMMSPQSPFGIEGIQPTGSPAFNMHQRHQSLQYPILPHQQLQQQQSMRASPRLHDVREDDEEGGKTPSRRKSEPTGQNDDNLQAEIEEAEYHLEEQFRNQLEHEDYNPQGQANGTAHGRQASGQQVPLSEHFANEPGKPMVLHHPRPHSRGHSLTQNVFQDGNQVQEGADQNNLKTFAPLNGIPETQKADETYEVETNPSDLGTPNPNFDFSASFGQHQKTASTASNPWDDDSNQRRTSHGSKPSFSKLNVQAPEFKFNPQSTFTPGQFSFGGTSFQPAIFQASPDVATDQPSEEPSVEKTEEKEVALDAPSESSVPTFTGEPKTFGFSSFTPGQSEFSFSSSGPKFRPDAPSFTPFQAITSPPPAGSKHMPRESIFGNIRIDTSDIIKPAKKSKAIPIVRPSSRTPEPPKIVIPADDKPKEDADGRPVDESRVKRAKSQAPDGDDVPLFAEQPKEATPAIEEEPTQASEEHEVAAAEPAKVIEEPTQPVEEPEPAAEEPSAEGDGEHALPADTSMSSVGTADQVDTKATTAAPSETSPAEENVNRWTPFEFESKFDATNFSEARPAGDEIFKETEHKPSLSASAQPFVPSGLAISNQAPAAVEPPKERSTSPTPKPQPASKDLGSGASRFATPSPKPKGLAASRFATPPPKPKGLSASRFASEPSPPVAEPQNDSFIDTHDADVVLPSVEGAEGEQTLAEIDDIMEAFQKDPELGVNRSAEGAAKAAPLADVAASPTYQLEPPAHTSIRNVSPREYKHLPELTVPELEKPLVESTQGSQPASQLAHSEDEVEEPRSPIASDWEGVFSADEHEKLDNRAQFFDGRVNEVVGNLLASRLEPLEQTLFSIQDALAQKSRRPVSSRRDMRSVSAERQQSDADDEDEEPTHRSSSPRRDRRMELIRAAVMEGIAAHHRAQPTVAPVAVDSEGNESESGVAKAIAEMKEQLLANAKPDFGGDELKNLIENAVQSRMPAPPQPDVDLLNKMEALQSKVDDLEERLQAEHSNLEKEIDARRTAQDMSADLHRQLQAAETRVEVEIINRSVFDQRVTDLEERLRHQENLTEEEVKNRRNAEDRLGEVQRLLRISSEEEVRLRETLEEKDQRIRTMEQANGKTSMKMALLEASQTNSTQSQTELTNKLNAVEADLRAVRQDNNHWRAEAERADETARRNAGELAHTLEENKHLQKSLNTLTTQLEENERLRESWRAKYISLQDDMSKAAREIAEENARRIKKDQAMFARQEVLDARLQAEAKTRERLEVEMERLQMNERSGMRAVKECERLEGLLAELRTENHRLEQRVLAAERDYEEARESGASEVKRTRMSMQTELDQANHQVNVIREELEEQNNKLRAEFDSFKLEEDTVKARYEMLLEEAETTKASEIEELKQKHQNELEDIQARYDQQRSVAIDESQRTEQNLLERLSFSASKIEHLQDRILHLEEKLEISKEAAAAAAAAAKSAGVESRSMSVTSPAAQPVVPAARADVPEKISPQALRESFMVLQEQLQAREQRIEELEQTNAKLDPEAPSKIAKRDDEISWLRELLAVRHGDLQDIITALSSDSFDQNRVKDAAIRLKANLQMEEQERERAMNGGSAIKLPNIAQSIQSATPKVAQTIGAAWGSWRKGSTGSFGSIGGRLNSPGARNATPSKPGPALQNSNLGGLMTPPASGIRQSPLMDSKPQPTAFGNTGRRFTSQGSTSGSGQGRRTSNTSVTRRAEKMPAEEPASPRRDMHEEPMTPPMMRGAVYDSDAQPGDFDDDGFFEDE